MLALPVTSPGTTAIEQPSPGSGRRLTAAAAAAEADVIACMFLRRCGRPELLAQRQKTGQARQAVIAHISLASVTCRRQRRPSVEDTFTAAIRGPFDNVGPNRIGLCQNEFLFLPLM